MEGHDDSNIIYRKNRTQDMKFLKYIKNIDNTSYGGITEHYFLFKMMQEVIRFNESVHMNDIMCFIKSIF